MGRTGFMVGTWIVSRRCAIGEQEAARASFGLLLLFLIIFLFPFLFPPPAVAAQGIGLEPVMHFGDRDAAQGQRPGNKPAQGNALGKSSITDKALQGRDRL